MQLHRQTTRIFEVYSEFQEAKYYAWFLRVTSAVRYSFLRHKWTIGWQEGKIHCRFRDTRMQNVKERDFDYVKLIAAQQWTALQKKIVTIHSKIQEFSRGRGEEFEWVSCFAAGQTQQVGKT